MMTMQGMIPRTKLQEALSELESLQAENQINYRKFLSLESQVAMAHEQLRVSAGETAELRSAMIKMIPLQELTDSEARNEALSAQLAKTEREHSQAVEQLQQRAATLEAEKKNLQFSMQV